MAIKGKTYYREKTSNPPIFKQVITVLSEPKKNNNNQDVVTVNKFSIDFTGFNNEIETFGNFKDDGEKENTGFIIPIEKVEAKKLRDFFICLFENEVYTHRGRND